MEGTPGFHARAHDLSPFRRLPTIPSLQRALRWTRAAVLAAALPAIQGCASTPSVAAPASRIAGAYRGSVVVGSQTFAATLDLSTSGDRDVRGSMTFTSPVEIDVDVTGVVLGDLLRVSARYVGADGCEGVIEGILDLDLEPGAESLGGPITVTDCDTPVAGSMRFRRTR